MKLEYGGGETAVFLDLQAGCLEEYCAPTAERIHERFGGRQYYRSRSGASGAGYIDDAPHLRQVRGYRVDVGQVRFPLPVAGQPETPAPIGSWRVYAPYDYHPECGGDTAGDWPCIIDVGGGLLHVTPRCWPLPAESAVEERFRLQVWTCPPGEVEPRSMEVEVGLWIDPNKTMRPQHWRRAVKAYLRDVHGLHWRSPQMSRTTRQDYFDGRPSQRVDVTDWEAPPALRADNPFWRRLGYEPLRRGEGAERSIAVIRQSMCEALTTDDLPYLQVTAPRGTTFLTRRCYVQERDGRCTIVMLDDDGVEVEADLQTIYLVDALRGNPENALMIAAQQMSAKRASMGEAEARLAAAKLAADEQEVLIDALPADLLVTIEDSRAAGNCAKGSLDWLQQHYPDDWDDAFAACLTGAPGGMVPSLPVAKLLPHRSDGRVRKVLLDVALRAREVRP
jgi:hypothetical protein